MQTDSEIEMKTEYLSYIITATVALIAFILGAIYGSFYGY